MSTLKVVSFLFAQVAVSLVAGQYQQPYTTTTPVPILKQIDRHNEDGSYSYGYEAADGSFKIESKYPNGEIYGKYGFIDDTGKTREIEYGATRRGFEPAGTDIRVPPSIPRDNAIVDPNAPEDDGQYHEDPSIYHTDPKYTNGEQYEPASRRPNPLNKLANYQKPVAPASYNYQSQRYTAPSNVYEQSVSQPQYQQQDPQQYQQQYQQQDPQQYQHQDPQQYEQESQQYEQQNVPQYQQQYRQAYQPQNVQPQYQPSAGASYQSPISQDGANYGR